MLDEHNNLIQILNNLNHKWLISLVILLKREKHHLAGREEIEEKISQEELSQISIEGILSKSHKVFHFKHNKLLQTTDAKL